MDYLATAKKAAIKAGEIQLRDINKIKSISYKDTAGKNNLLTEIDTECEGIILSIIRDSFPGHEILAEESGRHADADSEYRWLIDPLDGTMNYFHGDPFFCVSIALEHKGEIICGVVYDPVKEELFSAEKGRGAYLNEETIAVSNIERMGDSLLVSGTFHHPEEEIMDNFLEILKKLSQRAQGVRRDGSAALDLCYVACGRYESFWELGLNPWDMAAGALIVEEAGGMVTDLRGGSFTYYKGELVASNGLIHGEMIEIIKPYFK